MVGEAVTPDFNWYSEISRRRGLPPRCPFASVERCPRYYYSLSLMGEVGSTAIASADDEQLKDRWAKSDLRSRTKEQEPVISSSANKNSGWEKRDFSNFCPEVSYDRFGNFASGYGDYADEIDNDFADERLGSIRAPATDWRWRWAWLKPMHYSECPLYSLLAHGGKVGVGTDASLPEVTLGIPGANVRFELRWHALRKWVRARWRELQQRVWGNR
jgi:hypothetical protein